MIIKYPNEILMKPCKKVTKFDEALKDLINTMWVQMLQNNGLGLAANQIGSNLRVFIAQFEGKSYEIVNPTIIVAKGLQIAPEGCLSSEDGAMILTKRPRKLKIEYQTVLGKTRRLSVRDRLAQIFSHEIDHLDGVYYKERV